MKATAIIPANGNGCDLNIRSNEPTNVTLTSENDINMYVCTHSQIAPHRELERSVSDSGVGKHWVLITRITCDTHCVSTRGRSFCVIPCDVFSNGKVLKASSQLC